MSLKEKEAKLIEAGENLGRMMSDAGENKIKVLQKIKDAVKKFAGEMEGKGRYLDKSSLYAVAIIIDDELAADDELIVAAKAYIDADYEYIRALKEFEAQKA